MCHPQIKHFDILITLSCRNLKNWKCRERFSLNSHYLPEDRSSKRNQMSQIVFLGVLSTRNDWLLSWEETTSLLSTSRHTLSQMSTPPVHSPKGLFIIQKKKIFSPQRDLHPSFPLPSKMRFKPKFCHQGAPLIFPWTSPMPTCDICVNGLLLVLLLLACLSLQGSPLRTQKGRGEFFFSPTPQIITLISSMIVQDHSTATWIFKPCLLRYVFQLYRRNWYLLGNNYVWGIVLITLLHVNSLNTHRNLKKWVLS